MNKHKLKLGILLFGLSIFLVGCSYAGDDIQKFYKDAGFKGQITNVEGEPDNGFSIEWYYSFTYDESSGNKKYSAKVSNIMERRIADYKPEDFDSPEELANNFLDPMIEPLLISAFEESSEFKSMEEKIKTAISKVGFADRDIYLDYDLAVDDKFITSELTKDLKNAPSDAPLKGFSTLDFNKYYGLGMYEIVVYLDKPLPGFDINLLSTLDLPDGRYTFNVPEKSTRQYSDGTKEEFDVPRGYLVFEVKNGIIDIEYNDTDKYSSNK